MSSDSSQCFWLGLGVRREEEEKMKYTFLCCTLCPCLRRDAFHSNNKEGVDIDRQIFFDLDALHENDIKSISCTLMQNCIQQHETQRSLQGLHIWFHVHFNPTFFYMELFRWQKEVSELCLTHRNSIRPPMSG